MASNHLPIQIASSGGNTTVLTQSQANQILEKIRSMQSSNGGSATQTIKIQAVQTNPQTGAKQIVVIPISSTHALQQQAQAQQSHQQVITVSAATSSTRVVNVSSPMKVMRIPSTSVVASGSYQSNASTSQGVRVVKLPSTPVTTVTKTVYSPQIASSPSKILTATIQPPGDAESRKRSHIDFDAFSEAKKRKSEKPGKGLRHFSMKVCEKVQAKGTTSYNEVADELVNELTDPHCASPTDQQYDQKNIRRRVYDALNVLMAMNIISKEKKEIKWLGLPTNSIQESSSLEVDKAKRMERIKAKTTQLQDLILQQIAFKNLVERNKEQEKRTGPSAPNAAIQLPFIVVNTSKDTVIDCKISNDKMEYLFNFDDTFEIHDDMEVLKRMGLSLGLENGQVSGENLAKARQMVPRALEQYVVDLAQKGLGSSASTGPKISSPKVLKMEPMELCHVGKIEPQSEDTDTEVDIN